MGRRGTEGFLAGIAFLCLFAGFEATRTAQAQVQQAQKAYQVASAQAHAEESRYQVTQARLLFTEGVLAITKSRLTAEKRRVVDLQKSEQKGTYIGTFVATWYTAHDPGVNNVTATGQPLTTRVVAVDPNVIPYGTKVLLLFPSGQSEVRVAEDTGGAIVGNRLDIYCPSLTQALDNGIQSVRVYILGG